MTSGEVGEKADLVGMELGEKGDLASVVVVAAQLHHPATEGEVVAPRPPPPSRWCTEELKNCTWFGMVLT